MGTLQTAINTARNLINDFDPDGVYRYSDQHLTAFGNDALDAIAAARPELFYETKNHVCVSGVRQVVANSNGLVEVLNNPDGEPVTRMSRAALDLFDPAWRNRTAGKAKQWDRINDDPAAFMIYPPAEAGQVITVRHVAIPGEYAINATLPLTDTYIPIIADFIVAESQTRDAEHVNSGRAQAFLAKFYQGLGVTEQTSQGNT